MTTEQAIQEFENLISSIPEDFEIYYGTSTSTDKDAEGIAKAESDLPKYWKFIIFFDKLHIAKAVYEYLGRKGYKYSDAGEHRGFGGRDFSVFVYGIPKSSVKQNKNKIGCLGILIILFLFGISYKIFF